MFDEDIKIAGEKFTESKSPSGETEYRRHLDNGNIEKARTLGKTVAEKTVSSASLKGGEDEKSNLELQLQRGILLAFSAVVTIEAEALPSVVEDVAKQEYYNELKKLAPEIYKEATETGAFSFYYLAFRRGIELERRMGQTFAMLCSHDGDPIYHELGEALYCWMRTKTEKAIGEQKFIL